MLVSEIGEANLKKKLVLKCVLKRCPYVFSFRVFWDIYSLHRTKALNKADYLHSGLSLVYEIKSKEYTLVYFIHYVFFFCMLGFSGLLDFIVRDSVLA